MIKQKAREFTVCVTVRLYIPSRHPPMILCYSFICSWEGAWQIGLGMRILGYLSSWYQMPRVTVFIRHSNPHTLPHPKSNYAGNTFVSCDIVRQAQADLVCFLICISKALLVTYLEFLELSTGRI